MMSPPPVRVRHRAHLNPIRFNDNNTYPTSPSLPPRSSRSSDYVTRDFAFRLPDATDPSLRGMSANPLNGAALRCCTLIEPPMVFEDPNHPYGFNGVAIEYLSHLQRKLNFTCSTFSLFRLGNLTGFTDFIRHFDRCAVNGQIPSNSPDCPCDLGASGFALNPSRLSLVDYLPSFLNDDMRVVTHVANTAARVRGAFFLTTFTWQVWVAILALVVAFVLLKVVDKGFEADGGRHEAGWGRGVRWSLRATFWMLKSRPVYRVRKAVESVTLRMIAQLPDKMRGDTRSFRQRLLNFVILLCGLFLILAYEATMTASLVQETTVSEFATVRDFQNCKIPPTDVCLPGGGAIEAFWMQAVARHPCHRESGLLPTFVGSVDELLEKTARRECKFSIGTGSTLADATEGRYCGRLVLTGEHFLEGGCGFTLPFRSPLTETMTNATLQLRSEGALPTLTSYLQRFGPCTVLIDPILTFARLRLFFFLAYGVCAFMLLTIVFVPRNSVRRVNAAKAQFDPEEVISSEGHDSV